MGRCKRDLTGRQWVCYVWEYRGVGCEGLEKTDLVGDLAGKPIDINIRSRSCGWSWWESRSIIRNLEETVCALIFFAQTKRTKVIVAVSTSSRRNSPQNKMSRMARNHVDFLPRYGSRYLGSNEVWITPEEWGRWVPEIPLLICGGIANQFIDMSFRSNFE